MADQPELLEVGRVEKAHGLRGEVVVTLITDRTERLDPGSQLVAGQPLEVVAARRHQQRWIVSFAGVADRTSAERLRGLQLLAEPLDADDVELWAHEVIGAEAVTAAGVPVGRVVAVVANPASDLLELEGGPLVPAAFVIDTARLPAEVVIDPPEGLLD